MNWFSSLLLRRNEVAHQDEPVTVHPIEPLPTAAADRAGSLPRFRGAAADRLRADANADDRMRLRLRQAFTPARPIMDPSMLAGRTDLLRTMIRAIEDQYLHVILFGPRGIGKTSLLHVLCGIAQDSRYLVRYISCGERTSFDGLLRAVMTDIPLLFHANYDPTGTEIEEGLTFADLLDDGPVTVETASDTLNKVAGTRLLIVLDEFDRASEAEFRRSVAELIKNVSDRGSHVQIVIAGVAQNLTEIIEHVPSIRRNILGLLVPNMTSDEIAELISNGQKTSGMIFTPRALQLVSLASLGLPYLASLISQHAGFAALDRSSTSIDHTDVDRGVAQVLQHLKVRLAPDVQGRIEEAFAENHEQILSTLAQIALANSLVLRAEQVDKTSRTSLKNGPSSTQDLVTLANRFRLLEAVGRCAPTSYRFIDDGVPLYLWVKTLHEQAHDE